MSVDNHYTIVEKTPPYPQFVKILVHSSRETAYNLCITSRNKKRALPIGNARLFTFLPFTLHPSAIPKAHCQTRCVYDDQQDGVRISFGNGSGDQRHGQGKSDISIVGGPRKKYDEETGQEGCQNDLGHSQLSLKKEYQLV